MQLPWDEHFKEIVIPAWQAYLEAEKLLTEAVISKDETRIEQAKYKALREAGAAAFYLHHFGEIVLRARPHWLPNNVERPSDVTAWLSDYCTMLRSTEKSADVSLLCDVADALKHAILTRRTEFRDVAANDAVVVIDRDYGNGRFGEGKYGGIEQVWILAKSGQRALTSILQNVIDAWRRAAGLPLPELSAPG